MKRSSNRLIAAGIAIVCASALSCGAKESATNPNRTVQMTVSMNYWPTPQPLEPNTCEVKYIFKIYRGNPDNTISLVGTEEINAGINPVPPYSAFGEIHVVGGFTYFAVASVQFLDCSGALIKDGDCTATPASITPAISFVNNGVAVEDDKTLWSFACNVNSPLNIAGVSLVATTTVTPMYVQCSPEVVGGGLLPNGTVPVSFGIGSTSQYNQLVGYKDGSTPFTEQEAGPVLGNPGAEINGAYTLYSLAPVATSNPGTTQPYSEMRSFSQEFAGTFYDPALIIEGVNLTTFSNPYFAAGYSDNLTTIITCSGTPGGSEEGDCATGAGQADGPCQGYCNINTTQTTQTSKYCDVVPRSYQAYNASVDAFCALYKRNGDVTYDVFSQPIPAIVNNFNRSTVHFPPAITNPEKITILGQQKSNTGVEVDFFYTIDETRGYYGKINCSCGPEFICNASVLQGGAS